MICSIDWNIDCLHTYIARNFETEQRSKTHQQSLGKSELSNRDSKKCVGLQYKCAFDAQSYPSSGFFYKNTSIVLT